MLLDIVIAKQAAVVTTAELAGALPVSHELRARPREPARASSTAWPSCSSFTSRF
jgi:hypothetical protein